MHQNMFVSGWSLSGGVEVRQEISSRTVMQDLVALIKALHADVHLLTNNNHNYARAEG